MRTCMETDWPTAISAARLDSIGAVRSSLSRR